MHSQSCLGAALDPQSPPSPNRCAVIRQCVQANGTSGHHTLLDSASGSAPSCRARVPSKAAVAPCLAHEASPCLNSSDAMYARSCEEQCHELRKCISSFPSFRVQASEHWNSMIFCNEAEGIHRLLSIALCSRSPVSFQEVSQCQTKSSPHFPSGETSGPRPRRSKATNVECRG